MVEDALAEVFTVYPVVVVPRATPGTALTYNVLSPADNVNVYVVSYFTPTETPLTLPLITDPFEALKPLKIAPVAEKI
jgi:hypothetical protein